jgi:hypothetical protein
MCDAVLVKVRLLMERHSCLNHEEITERAGFEFYLHILSKYVSFFIFFITDCKGRHDCYSFRLQV